MPITQASPFFGLLQSKASVLLGEISYSIYLLHGLVLFFGFQIFPSLADVSYEGIIFLMPGFAVVVVLVASLTFLAIEHRGMSLGRRVVSAFDLKFARKER